MSRLVVVLSGILLALNLGIANAGAHKTKKNQQADTALAETPAKLRGDDRDDDRRRSGGRTDGDAEDSDDVGDGSDDIAGEIEEILGGDDADEVEDILDGDDESGSVKERGNSAGKGSERAQEMRARRDERKAIQDEYRSGRDDNDEPDIDADDDAGEESAKKPWWKFWE